MSNNKKHIFLLLAVILLTSAANSQTRISSPYSRYGIGDLQNNKYLRNMSIGGISYGFRDATCINYANPASYTVFDTTSFVMETGLTTQIVDLSTKSLSQRSNYTSLAFLTFGFPVTKWWGASIGLLPFSSVGYKVSYEQTPVNIGRTKYTYEGAGGLNQFYFGHAFKPWKNLSAGFNASLLFGSLDKIATVSFPDSSWIYAIRLKNSTYVNDFCFSYGLQYTKKLNNDMNLVIGAVYNTDSKLMAKRDSFAYRFILAQDGSEIVVDTLVNSENAKGNIVLPTGFGGGFTLGKQDRWLLGADYHMQQWKEFSVLGEKDSLKNSWGVSFGAEYTPKNTAVSGYWRRVHYRLGTRYDLTYLSLKDNQLKEKSISFGLGLPLKRTKTALNLGVELGMRGTMNDDLIQEKYIRVLFSMAIYERWFIKRRFD